MDFALTEEQQAIGIAVGKVCEQFTPGYWRDRDEDGVFPHEFHSAMAEGGWLGITMPEDLGGSGLGLVEAAIMMHAVGKGGGAMSAVSSIHINLFGPHPIVKFGTQEQKIRWLKPLIAGTDKTAFGVTEPNAGLDTTAIETFAEKVEGGYKVNGRKIWTSTAQVANKILLLTRTTKREDAKRKTDGITLFYTDLDRGKIDVQRIPKMGRKAVDSNAVFIDDLFIPDEDLLGEEGKGFSYLLHSLNPERVLIGIEAVGIGQCALDRSAQYARDRVVFDRPIGMNQGIQHPLAENWAYLEAAYTMCLKTAWTYDNDRPCGPEANACKLLGARAGYDACFQAVMTHGGMGYAKEFDVERFLREVMIARLAPVSEQMILSHIAEKALDLPKSY
jgi:acyl-CoA dehydrogenase